MENRIALQKKTIWTRLWEQKIYQVFVWIGLLFIILFKVLPLFGIIIAFKDYNIASGIEGIFANDNWVGLKHFQDFFSDPNFLPLLKNTLALSLWKLVFTFPIPIFLAIVINELVNTKYKRIVQTVSYLPYFFSWVVITGLITVFCSSTGVINTALQSLGLISEPIAFLTSPGLFRPVAVFSAVWKETGWWTIIFLSAITSIDSNLYEAATIDGASRWQCIRYITLPALKPTIFVVLILAIGGLMAGGLGGGNFSQAYLLQNGGNMETADILETYVLRTGMLRGRYSFATAAGLFQSVVSLVLVYSANAISRKVNGSGLY